MNSPTVQIRLHRARLTDPKPLPVRHDRPPTQITPRIIRPSFAGHDFLVPNPRPDLTTDPHMLRMIEAG